MSTLKHESVYEDHERVATQMSLGPELGPLGAGATFPLVEDPRQTDRTAIIGMFVLRPARRPWTAAILDAGQPRSMFAAEDWSFNVRGVDGGWLIAGGNPLDAYRLALQYGLSDAVIVGSNTVAKEGVDHGAEPGYLWQPYGPATWPHLAALDPGLTDKIARVRSAWQQDACSQHGAIRHRSWFRSRASTGRRPGICSRRGCSLRATRMGRHSKPMC